MSLLSPGLVLQQRYTVAALLSAAGGRAVYRAGDARTGGTVMLECVSASLEQLQPVLVSLRQLKHPNLLVCADAFEHEGQLIMVMEDAPGGSLRALLEKGPLPPAQARQMALDVCDALGRAHQQGLLHGALTPDCIYLDEQAAPKLAGFGLAALAGSGVGDLRYSPPEAWQNQPFDARTDIWLLGATFYEMLAGRPALVGDTPAALRSKALAADYAPLPDGVPPGLAAIVARMLVAPKRARYATLREAAVDLELGAPADTVPPPTPQPAAPRQRPAPARWPGLVLMGLALIFFVVGLANLPAVYGRALTHAQLVAEQARQAATALPSATVSRASLPPTSMPTASAVSTRPPSVTPRPTPPSGAQAAAAPTQAPSSAPSTSTAALSSSTSTAALSPSTSTAALSPSTSTAALSQSTPTAPLPPHATQDVAKWYSAPVTWTSPVDGMILVFVPAGEYSDSSSGNSFYLDAFWMDWSQVTNAQYAKFRAARPDYQPLNCDANQPLYRRVEPAPSSADDYPVVNVNWYDAAAYCAWAGRRLPTEVEWYKTGGLEDSRFYNGDDFCPGDGSNDFTVTCRLSSGQTLYYRDYLLKPRDGYAYTAPVRHYPQLNWSGNVWEWVADWYFPSFVYTTRNPQGPAFGFEHQRLVIGGGWDRRYNASSVASFDPSYQSPSLGFRCAASAAP